MTLSKRLGKTTNLFSTRQVDNVTLGHSDRQTDRFKIRMMIVENNLWLISGQCGGQCLLITEFLFEEIAVDNKPNLLLLA